MITPYRVNNLSVGASLDFEQAGFDIELTRNFCTESKLNGQLTVVITPKNFRSDDEWRAGVSDAASAEEFVKKSIGPGTIRLSA